MNRSGWTGGQYSLLRGTLGACLALGSVSGLFSASAVSGVLYLGAFIAAVSLALGVRHHLAATGLLIAGMALGLAGTGPSLQAAFVWGVLLIAAASTEGAPYGSWPARGRPDVDAGWTLPPLVTPLAWIGLGLAYALLGSHCGALGVVPGLVFIALGHQPAQRRWLWIASAAAQLLGLGDPDWPSLPLALLQWLSFDPLWVPRAAVGERATVFYDGSCGLCHRTVRFLISEDAEGEALRFAPFESESFARTVPEAERGGLPDSVILALPDGQLRVRSEAILEIGRRLGGLWRALAELALFLPAGLRDSVYDAVARARADLFARPEQACPRVPPELRARFLG